MSTLCGESLRIALLLEREKSHKSEAAGEERKSSGQRRHFSESVECKVEIRKILLGPKIVSVPARIRIVCASFDAVKSVAWLKEGSRRLVGSSPD